MQSEAFSLRICRKKNLAMSQSPQSVFATRLAGFLLESYSCNKILLDAVSYLGAALCSEDKSEHEQFLAGFIV